MRNKFLLTCYQENSTHSSQSKESSLFSQVCVSKNSQNYKSTRRKKNNQLSLKADNRCIHSKSTQEQGAWANTDVSLCITVEGVCALIQHAYMCRDVWKHVHQNSDYLDGDFCFLLLLFYIVSTFMNMSIYFYKKR